MKYVTFQHLNGKVCIPVMFPDYVSHDSVSLGPNWKPISAGHIAVKRMLTKDEALTLTKSIVFGPEDYRAELAIILDTVQVHGSSPSLKLKPDGLDALRCCLVVNGLEQAVGMVLENI